MRHNRGIPTEEVLAEMRFSDPPIYYLVRAPKGRLSQQQAGNRAYCPSLGASASGVKVKLLSDEGELYMQTQSQDRSGKDWAMRKRRLERVLWIRAVPDTTSTTPSNKSTIAWCDTHRLLLNAQF
jgi:hypothetical protein